MQECYKFASKGYDGQAKALMMDVSLLIIEDDHDLRKGIAAYFRDMGYAILEASDGKEGI